MCICGTDQLPVVFRGAIHSLQERVTVILDFLERLVLIKPLTIGTDLMTISTSQSNYPASVAYI